MKEKVFIIGENNINRHYHCKDIKYIVDEKECHICISHTRTRDGYPVINRLNNLNNGDIPNNLCVMHSCDDPNCINIKHLSLGTHKENMEDRDAKGRLADKHGFLNPNCTLDVDTIIEIKKCITEGNMRQIDIAKKFNIQRATISVIQRGARWSEIEVEGFKPTVKRKTPVKLTNDKVLEILINDSNLSYKEISKKYGIAQSTVANIKKGRVYKNITIPFIKGDTYEK